MAQPHLPLPPPTTQGGEGVQTMTGVLAFFLLQAANLMPNHEKLIRTAAKLEYKDMREKIKKVFDETGDNVVDCVP